VKLYCVGIAPNPTKVMLYIAEKRAAGAAIELEQVTVKLMAGEHNEAAHRARTPFASLPVLEISPGDYIIESLAIMEYFEELHPEPDMLGGTPRERARRRELERIADSRVLTPLARCIHATNSPLGLPPSEDIAAVSRQTLDGGLEYFDRLLADGRPFIAGDTVTFSDCTLAAGLQFGRFAGIEVDATHAHLHRWDHAYRQREAARAVLLR
jgi:glutathione S-transferase